MAQDATGTPTSPDSIPKYNTAVDAPSGRGFNAAMDAIQLALNGKASTASVAAKVDKPTGIVSGEVPVWDGAQWVRSSATKIGPTSLGTGTPDATVFLRGDGAWVAAASTVGTEVAYTERNSNLGLTTTVQDFIDTGSISYLNVPYMIEFFVGKVDGPTSLIGTARFSLYDGATDLGIIAEFGNQTWGSGNFTPSGPVLAKRKITPTAASHQYKIRVAMTANTGTAYAGAGGAATMLPAYVRITRAS